MDKIKIYSVDIVGASLKNLFDQLRSAGIKEEEYDQYYFERDYSSCYYEHDTPTVSLFKHVKKEK